MQAKGLVQFFAIALVVVCIYQLSFTWVTNNVEKDAKQYATENVTEDVKSRDSLLIVKEQYYLDSMSNEVVYDLGIIDFTFQKTREQQISLGLDLQGGMNVVLQVSIEDMIRAMSYNHQDVYFNQALKMAREKEKTEQKDFITLFGEAYKEVNPMPDQGLANIFAVLENQDRINLDSSDDEVLALIREEAEDAIQRTFNILRSRIDKFGVTQPNISLQASTGRIIVELPGVGNPERVRRLLQATAKLEFWETYTNVEIYPYLLQANNIVRDKLGLAADTAATDSVNLDPGDDDIIDLTADDEPAPTDTTKDDTLADADNELLEFLSDTTGADTSDALSNEELRRQNPLFAVLGPAFYTDESGNQQLQNGPVVGYSAAKDTATVNHYLAMRDVKAAFPRNVKLLWGAKSLEEGSDIFALYAIKTQLNEEEAPLVGDVIVDARQDFDQNAQPEISMKMNTEGAKIWKKMTGENINKSIAIVLDDVVYSAPNVIGEIPNGNSSISGQFTINEAKDLANILKAGKLPSPAKIVEEAVVGPSLGQESIDNGLRSLISGLVIVLLFMIFYYSGSGIVANLALVSNLFFIMGVLGSLGATLTLPGMAGIVLTIGMAVDANVIIFERIREELLKGKGLRLAIIDGYKNSYSSIVDANVTTILVGFILYAFGTGPILGFATILIIGIFSSMFTAILISRLVIDWYTAKERAIGFATNLTRGAFKKINVNFIDKRKFAYVVSGIVVLVGIGSMFTKGFDLGVDFQGGRTYVVRFDQEVSTDDIKASLNDVFGSYPIVKTFGGNNQVKITTSYMIDSTATNTDDRVEAKLYEGLQGQLGDDVTLDIFKEKHKLSSQKVGPTIADDILDAAIWATVFSLIGMFLYILIRFRKWQFGLGAVISLFHNVMVLLAIFSLLSGILPFSLEIDQAFIAALLTVIGYSINDTVVVFDRIREYLSIHHTKDMKTTINLAINSTLSRTLITSFTTLVVVIILFIFGGEMIRGFSFALLIGIMVGTYSSIFIATPIVVDLSKESKKA